MLPKASDGADDADAAAAADDDDDDAAGGGVGGSRVVERQKGGNDRPTTSGASASREEIDLSQEAARVVRREGLEGRPDGGVPRGQARADLIDRKSHNWFQLG